MGGKPVDCKLKHQCSQVKAKLESEIELGKAMQVQVITNLDEFAGVHEALSSAIEDAERKNADPARVSSAKTLRRKLMSEASLMRAVQGPQKTTPGHITMLEELTTAAKAESANEELVSKATVLIAKLKSEREVQRRIAETAPLCSLESDGQELSWAKVEKREGLPAWSAETEQFEEWHEEYKKVVEQADVDKIAESLMTTALEQLATIELLLIQKKQTEEEQKLKLAKKKGKK